MKSTLAARIAENTMRNLRGRKGVLDDVEQDIQEEMESELAKATAHLLAAEFGGQATGSAVTL